MTGGSDQVGDFVCDRTGKKIAFVTVAQGRAFATAPTRLSRSLSTQVEADDRVRQRDPVRGADAGGALQHLPRLVPDA